MWPEAREQTALGLGLLRRLTEMHRPLVARCRCREPEGFELSALAAMLHSFYTGVENVLKRIVLEVDGVCPSGRAWHRELLDLAAAPTAARPAVLSADTREMLAPYLQFRHVFRQAYTFDLEWRRMSDLVLGCEAVLGRLEADLDDLFRDRG